MANYTIEFKDIVEHYSVFAFPYAYYDEKKRKDFERKFIQHFYFREICCPTVEQFLHFLRDKMETVFPYYNELMHTATLEYSVLDNYDVTETFERKYENTGKSHGVSSNVGQVMDERKSETDDKRIAQGSETGIENQNRNVSGEGSSNKKNQNSGTVNDEDKRRFLDTPQGKLDLTDMEYLTTLNQDSKNTTSSSNGSEEGSERHSETDKINTNSSRTLNEKTDTTSETTMSGNQKSTNDNNTRMESHDEHAESYVLKKKGNIGVDTDADMIQKHINLQKVLTQIERMFFDDCEDLFMMVW